MIMAIRRGIDQAERPQGAGFVRLLRCFHDDVPEVDVADSSPAGELEDVVLYRRCRGARNQLRARHVALFKLAAPRLCDDNPAVVPVIPFRHLILLGGGGGGGGGLLMVGGGFLLEPPRRCDLLSRRLRSSTTKIRIVTDFPAC